MARRSILLSFVLLATSTASAKDKEKTKIVLPEEVLRAETASVVIYPHAGEPLTSPIANQKAREAVEQALRKWGRFRVMLEPYTADLLFVVRAGTGKSVSPTIQGGPIDNRPVILGGGDNGDVRVGGERGRPPDLNWPGAGQPPETGPHLGTEVGASEDLLEVYRGNQEYPLDPPPVWRYMARNALHAPAVSAVDQFRKAMEEAEKAPAQKKQKPTP